MKIIERAISPGRLYKPKPYVFPEDFAILVDTREQEPLCTKVKGLTIYREKLKDADYSIKGFQDQFAIERKKTSDFFSYIGREREKTIEKLKRFKEFEFAGIIIEASFDDLLSPLQLYTQVSPETARQFLVSANVKYGIHVFCNRDRKNLEMWLLDRAIKYFKLKREV